MCLSIKAIEIVGITTVFLTVHAVLAAKISHPVSENFRYFTTTDQREFRTSLWCFKRFAGFAWEILFFLAIDANLIATIEAGACSMRERNTIASDLNGSVDGDIFRKSWYPWEALA